MILKSVSNPKFKSEDFLVINLVLFFDCLMLLIKPASLKEWRVWENMEWLTILDYKGSVNSQ
jgi:hypothetical protein